MFTLYGFPASTFCAKVRVAMRHKGLEWTQLPPPGGYKTDAYKEVVTSGNLPALIDGDVLLADSEAINEYLNDKYPDNPLLPSDLVERARARERSRFHDTRLEPEMRKLYPYIREENRDPALNAVQAREISIRLGQLAKMLRAEPADDGSTLNLGNIGYCFTFIWINALAPVLDMDITWPDEVIQFRNKLEAHPSMVEEIDIFRTAVSDWFSQNITS
jgi:glutathione S-transferase